MLRHGLYPVETTPKDKTISDIKQRYLIPVEAKIFPQTKLGILNFLRCWCFYAGHVIRDVIEGHLTSFK